MKTPLAVAALCLLCSCGGYKKDVETVCNVRSHVTIPKGADAAEEAEAIKAYLFVQIHSPKAKKVFLSLGSMGDAEKVALLRKEAGEVGLSSCPLADEAEAALKKKADGAPKAPAP